MIPLIGATIFLIYLNVPAVLVSDYGVPVKLALLVPLMLGVPVAYRVLVWRESLRFPGMILAAMLMLACHALSAILSAQPNIAFQSVFSWLAEGVLLAFLLVNALRTRREVFVAARAIVAAGAVMGLIVLIQQILGPTDHNMAGFGKLSSEDLDHEVYRLAGPIGEKNRFAQIMAVLIPVAAGLGVAANPRRRWIYGIAVLLIFTGVILSYSRGTMVALVIVVPFAVFFGLLRIRHLVLAVVAVAVLLTAMPFISVMPNLASRVASIGDVAVQSLGLKPGGLRNTDGAVRGRLTAMKAAGLLFLDHPIIGAGPGLAPMYYQRNSILVGGKLRATEHRTHNLYLQLAAETGVVGLFAYLLVVGSVLYPLDRKRRRIFYTDRQLWGLLCGLELGLLIFLATSVFLHAAYIRYCWMLFALAVAATAIPCRAIEPDKIQQVMRELRRILESRPRALPGPVPSAKEGGAHGGA